MRGKAFRENCTNARIAQICHSVFLALIMRSRVPASVPLLSVVGGEPRRISVRIGDYPGASQERRVKNGLAPLERNFGAYCHDGYPYQKQEQCVLQGGEGGRHSCIVADEHRDARRDE